LRTGAAGRWSITKLWYTICGKRSRAVIRRVAFIVFAQKIGLTLEEIGAELAKLPQDRVPERVDWSQLSACWTRRIDERLADLTSHGMHRLL
jgi:DNA-binding transcriptional MerR regulator